jgi:hypothetical protein
MADKLSSVSLGEGLRKFKGSSLIIFLFVKIIAPAPLWFSLFLLLASIIIIPLIALKEGREFLLNLNAYGNLVISILTFFLVLITGFYALVTNKMLSQMREDKQSAIKPALWITVEAPEFHDNRYSGNGRKDFGTSIQIANYGKGAAVGVQTGYTIPDEWKKDNMRIGTGSIHPGLLTPGGVIVESLNIPTMAFDIEHNYPDYLRVKVLYEDTERNLYILEHSYYLAFFHSHPKYYLNPESESLHFITFKDRKYLSPSDESLNSDKRIRVFERVAACKPTMPETKT